MKPSTVEQTIAAPVTIKHKFPLPGKDKLVSREHIELMLNDTIEREKIKNPDSKYLELLYKFQHYFSQTPDAELWRLDNTAFFATYASSKGEINAKFNRQCLSEIYRLYASGDYFAISIFLISVCKEAGHMKQFEDKELPETFVKVALNLRAYIKQYKQLIEEQEHNLDPASTIYGLIETSRWLLALRVYLEYTQYVLLYTMCDERDITPQKLLYQKSKVGNKGHFLLASFYETLSLQLEKQREEKIFEECFVLGILNNMNSGLVVIPDEANVAIQILSDSHSLRLLRGLLPSNSKFTDFLYSTETNYCDYKKIPDSIWHPSLKT